MYYEIHGEGEPLILLHGGVGAIEMFGEVLPLLAEGRRVIAVDLQAHGRTADIDRPMTLRSDGGRRCSPDRFLNLFVRTSGP
jgi:pimeloyl-ACP methyl ester carboxylesterase